MESKETQNETKTACVERVQSFLSQFELLVSANCRRSRRWHALEPLEGFLLQGFPVVRVGDLDQGVGPLPQVLAEQEGDAVLGDDVVDVGPGRHDSAACASE